MAKKKLKANHDLILRFGFVIFLAIWGFEHLFRADMWTGIMGNFYGDLGSSTNFIITLGVVELLIAASFLFNFFVRWSSLLLFAMLAISTIVTIVPLINYLCSGRGPMPEILFADHFPLLAAAWAIFAHRK